jgi:formate hydrogenlyase subunit 3/multisubunit Na+/H+ antiporter MnhD subunit
MTKRPPSVTVIGCLFAAAGLVGLAYHASEFKAMPAFQYELVWVCFVRLLAILCGIFMLRGRNWARWGLLGWVAYHVILSAFHSPAALVMHSLLFAVVAYFLLRPHVSAYFRSTRTGRAPIPGSTPPDAIRFNSTGRKR